MIQQAGNEPFLAEILTIGTYDNLTRFMYNIKSTPSLNYTVISIDSSHMRKDGSNDLRFLFNT